MKKRTIVGIVSTGIVLFAIAGSSGSQPQPSSLDNTKSLSPSSTVQETQKIAKPICDGTIVTTGCTVEGVNYTSYVYQPEVAEKSHTETITTYKEKVAGYCTLCNDGTYSPSCATGRGACSHHGGVDQWNAPRYSQVPEYTTKTIVDAPAQAAYYKKIAE